MIGPTTSDSYFYLFNIVFIPRVDKNIIKNIACT